MLYQFLVSIPHILRPDDISGIDVSPVVDPFVNRIVSGTVANNDEVPAACMPKSFQDFGALPVPGINIGIPRHSKIFSTDAVETHGETQDGKGWDKYSSQVVADSAPLPKVAQSLNHDGIDDAGQGRKIVRLVPGLNRYTSEGNNRSDEKKLHTAIANNTR